MRFSAMKSRICLSRSKGYEGGKLLGGMREAGGGVKVYFMPVIAADGSTCSA